MKIAKIKRLIRLEVARALLERKEEERAKILKTLGNFPRPRDASEAICARFHDTQNTMKDIALFDAMIAWNDPPPRGDGRMKVVQWPDTSHECNRLQLVNTTGACWVEWRTWTPLERMNKLMWEIWEIVFEYNVPVQTIHDALWVIPEYRAQFMELKRFLSSEKRR